MQRDDVIDLLAIVQATDNREVGPVDVNVWAKIIGHLDRDECTDAIMAHRREQPGVWLEPGHIAARVKARHRDRYDRMDPDERAVAIADAEAAATSGFARRDRYGFIDKSMPDEPDYPADWDSAQRLNESWARIDEFRDRQEHAMAFSRPSSLLLSPPASAETRARALAEFAAHQGTLDGGEVMIDESIPHVNALAVACPFCQAAVGDKCSVAPMPVGKYSTSGKRVEALSAGREKVAWFHPSRVETAAIEQGLGTSKDDPLIRALVAIECGKQVSRAKQGWGPRDAAPAPLPPMPTSASAPAEPIDAEVVDEAHDDR